MTNANIDSVKQNFLAEADTRFLNTVPNTQNIIIIVHQVPLFFHLQGCKLIRSEKGDKDVNPYGGSGAWPRGMTQGPNVSNVIQVEFGIRSMLANSRPHGNNIDTKRYIQNVMASTL